MRSRTVLILLAAALVCAAALAGWRFLLAPRVSGELRASLGHGDYSLVTTDGGAFDETTLEGHASAVFFGFTHCPEVCPTTLGDIGDWLDRLGPEAGDLRIWFVTVDPERDGVEMLRDYIAWTPGVTGVSGSAPEIEKARSAFRIYARKVPLSDGGYTMDHTSSVLLFDRAGRFVETIAYQEPADSAVAKLRRLLQ